MNLSRVLFLFWGGRRKVTLWFFGWFVVLMMVVSAPAYAVRVGWNVDIHQNKFINPGDYANDFHVWGC